jgi:integrase
MNPHSSFAISEFTNPSGDVVFRVSGWLDGKRVRKNFSTRPDAEAERQVLEIQLLQRETGIRTAATRLSDDQLHEAETVFRQMAGKPRSMAFYVDYALANYREPVSQKLLTEAVTEYLASKQHEREQDQLSEPYFVSMKRDFDRLQKHFPGATVAELTGKRLLGYLEARRAALKTYNNRRGIVATFLKFALQRDWLTDNPLAKIPARRIRRRRKGAATLTAEQAREIMAFVEKHYPSAVPFFALCLFGGIRPCLRTGEILRLRPDHISLDAGIIRIDGEVSKVREPRNVTIQPNLAAWLRAYPLKKYPIIPTNLQHVREKVVEAFGLTHDVMRHTFISMFVARFRSIGEAALQAGNSESIIRKHYLDLKTPEEAEQFFGILPRKSSEPHSAIVAMPPAPIAPVLAVAI